MKLLSKNMFFTISYQVLFILSTFIIRKCFITYLGIEILGVNSVFTNLLSALNLAELGIGSAITSHLYKPLYEKNYEEINTLMSIFKKLYNILGILVFIIGCFFSFKMYIFFPDISFNIGYIQMLFIISLIGTTSTYFLAYYRTLLIADQNNIFISSCDSIIHLIISILQIVFLVLFKSFTIYLILNILNNIISNLIIRIYVNNHYPLKYIKLDNSTRGMFKQILTYIKDVSIAKIGAYIYYSTDNLIISFFKGAVLTGIISNYTLITTTIKNLITAFLNPVQASLGNIFIEVKDSSKRFNIFTLYWYFLLLLSSIVYIEILCLADDFIILFFGAEYLISNVTLFLLSINLLMTILLILPSQLFVIFRLYKFDKIIIVTSAILNAVISIGLMPIIGVNGVFIGTFVTSLIYLLSRLFIITKEVLYVNFIEIKGLLINSILFIIVVSFIILKISRFIVVADIWILVAKGIIILIICLLLSMVILLNKKIRIKLYNFLKGEYTV